MHGTIVHDLFFAIFINLRGHNCFTEYLLIRLSWFIQVSQTFPSSPFEKQGLYPFYINGFS